MLTEAAARFNGARPDWVRAAPGEGSSVETYGIRAIRRRSRGSRDLLDASRHAEVRIGRPRDLGDHISRRNHRTRRIQDVLNPRLQPFEHRSVDLGNARFINSQPVSDLFHRQVVLVVERHQVAVAFGNAAQGTVEDSKALAPVAQIEGACANPVGQGFLIGLAEQRCLHRPYPVDAHGLKLTYRAVPLFQAHAESGGHLAIVDGTAQPGFELPVDLLGFLSLLSHVARRCVQTAQPVQNGAADAIARVAFELDALASVKLAYRVDQTQHAGAHQIIHTDVGRQVFAQLKSRAPYERQKLYDQPVVLRFQSAITAERPCSRRAQLTLGLGGLVRDVVPAYSGGGEFGRTDIGHSLHVHFKPH